MTETGRELIAHLKHFEGFVAKPYYCAAGKLTIGYGHRIDEPQPAMTEEQATALLLTDIAKYTLMAVRLSPGLVSAAPRRLNAIIDFCFNAGGSAYAGSTLRSKVNAGLWDDAAAQMRRWVYVTNPKTQVKAKSAWQIKRREVTAKWLETPNA
jgi:lysozyme